MSYVVQYELWRECNCKCTFCTLGYDNLHTDNDLKLKSLQTAIDEMKQMKEGEHETIGFIGGEFFQGQLSTEELRTKWFELMNLCNDMLNNNIIKTIWLNASLLIGSQPDFYKSLDIFDKKNQVWVLTSYDTWGRFHTQKMFDTWEGHLEKIHNEYPEINVNITSIITGDFIEKFLNNEIDIHKYTKKYNYSIYLKNPVQPLVHEENPSNKYFESMLPNFFPTRNSMLKFFSKYLEMYGEEEYERLISTDLRADEIRKNYNNNTQRNLRYTRNRETLQEFQEGDEDAEEEIMECGHNNIYKSYIDSDKCILCDKQLIKKTMGNI